MFRTSLRGSVASFALAALVAAGMTAAPLSLTDDLSLDAKTAEAKNGRGGGNDKGGRGGNDRGGRGGGNDKGGNDKGGKGGNGKSGGNSSASAGKSKSSFGTEEAETEEVETARKGGLGSLSASNASATARANASPNSRVGAIAEYENALAAGDVEAAANALARAANKEISPENVGAVNHNLGIEATPEEEAEMAALAEAARTAAPEEGEGEETTAEGEGDGTTEDGVDEIAAAAEELISGDSEGDTSTQ